MGKYLQRRLNWSPFCRRSIVLSSLDRSVVTRRRSFSRSGSTPSLALAPTVGHGEVSSKKIKLEFALSSFDHSVVTRPFCRHSAQIVLSQSRGSISRGHSLALSRSLARSLAVTRSLSSFGPDHSLTVARIDLSRSLGAYHSLAVAWLDLSRSLARLVHSAQIVLSSLDRYVVTRPLCRRLTVLSSFDHSVVVRLFCRQSTILSSLSADRSLAVDGLDLLRSLARCPHSAQIVLSQSLGSISRGHSTQFVFSQSLGLISRGH
ncbi:hypothetical protein F2Q69_00042432 [Brassica cretica]|uniref:Uncharacterized protein n=1 Tax=Brassica cretica TaxID=69181 RepID=A0A8S9NFP2_BRACR|nr:hypothetical protein F2Q69_00042432 [Brassica cretica]